MINQNKFRLLLVVFTLVFVAMTVPVCASSQKFVAIATGDTYSLALTDDGNVWTWGNISSDPELNGDYSGNLHQVPISGVVAIAAGFDSSYALKSDGTVWAWGINMYGKLGDGTTKTSFTPVQVAGLSNVTQISGGGTYGIALKSDGTVWTWGLNVFDEGRFGDGTRETRLTPVRVKGLDNVKDIMGPCFAIKDDGTVWAWGSALNMTNVTEAFQVPGLKNIKSIDMSYGFGHAVFVRDDGTVWSWGNNNNGEFGNGTFMRGNTFFNETFQAKGLTDVKAVSASISTCMALKNDGTVWGWGHNIDGMLGTGQMCEMELTPVMIQGFDGVVAISAKGDGHSVFLKEDGSVWECGSNNHGEMGDISIIGAYIKYDTTIVNSTYCYIDKPVKILGPDTGIPSGVNTTETPNLSVSDTIPPQDTGLLNIVIAACALLLIGGFIVYYTVIRKM